MRSGHSLFCMILVPAIEKQSELPALLVLAMGQSAMSAAFTASASELISSFSCHHHDVFGACEFGLVSI